MVPVFCVVAALLIGGKSRVPRWLLGAVLVITGLCSGVVIFWTKGQVTNEELRFAAQIGKMDRVEAALAAGADPLNRELIDSTEGPNAIEVAREFQHEEVARRLERAVRESGRTVPKGSDR